MQVRYSASPCPVVQVHICSDGLSHHSVPTRTFGARCQLPLLHSGTLAGSAAFGVREVLEMRRWCRQPCYAFLFPLVLHWSIAFLPAARQTLQAPGPPRRSQCVCSLRIVGDAVTAKGKHLTVILVTASLALGIVPYISLFLPRSAGRASEQKDVYKVLSR
ncbi:hypothetical protein FA95DRAFT_1220457 [Auriscalpium vulgare]|uniref:Uncharacterized protein n=1 Tax=Auriscalpium vulgare TaxID=40419 RepID=A0ACB8RTJ0_9AGAM|nr:hypothetical protein FA95DRAFT_1220457 [Auriscalpium vulgare]